MNESTLRRALLVIAILGLALGVGVWRAEFGSLVADTIWTIATLPVVVALAISILRDFWIGRFGVDAIALVSMSAALLLGQSLAAVVVAIMYAG
ncbi:MAG: heavy metal translocating P-type ATPase, partial [Mesorhizobium sp.]